MIVDRKLAVGLAAIGRGGVLAETRADIRVGKAIGVRTGDEGRQVTMDDLERTIGPLLEHG